MRKRLFELINSRVKGVYNLSPHERIQKFKEALSDDGTWSNFSSALENGLNIDTADAMIENVVGKFELPVGIATNFTINGRDYLIPMAVEEPSVVAAASNMARIVRDYGGFSTTHTGSIMIGQVHITNVPDLLTAEHAIIQNKEALIQKANSFDQTLTSLGGGVKDIEVRKLQLPDESPLLTLHLIVNVLDAMGANAINTIAERLTPEFEELTKGTVLLRILSNLADKRVVSSTLKVHVDSLKTPLLSGLEVAERMVTANHIAKVDPYRAATHNKGIMNGIDPVVVITGNDWRAIEAGAHAYAVQNGMYQSLTDWWIEENHLHGRLSIPMAVGTVGGATKTHPLAQASLGLMQIKSAQELSEVIVSVGLAQNMGAIRALATEGIQRGHMSLHARNIAVQAGATKEQMQEVVRQLVESKDVRMDNALKIVKELTDKRGN